MPICCDSPNYVPSIEASNPDTVKESNAAMVRFKRVSHRSKLQEERRRQSERDMMALREATKQKELMLRRHLDAFNNDHAYATQPSTNTDLLSLQCQSDSILFQPDGFSMRSVEVHSENEYVEEVNCNTSIPVEIGKTAVCL